MMYKEIETKQIKSIDEIKKEYNEIIHNSVYTESELSELGSFEDFLNEFYFEISEE